MCCMAPMAAMEMEMGSLGGGGKWKTMPVGDSKPLCSARNILCGCGALLLVVLIAIGATLSGAVAAPTSLPSFAEPSTGVYRTIAAAATAAAAAAASSEEARHLPRRRLPSGQPAAGEPGACAAHA